MLKEDSQKGTKQGYGVLSHLLPAQCGHEIPLQGMALHQSPLPPNQLLLGDQNPKNSRSTATRLGPGILKFDIHREGCFLVQSWILRFRLLTTKVPTFVNLDFQNITQAGTPRNCRFPLRILIFVNNNKGLWSSPGKKRCFQERGGG